MNKIARPRVRGFEWWMISNVGVGAATGSFLSLLIPPFVTTVTGNAARVGIVFAVISLAAAVGPWVGKLADRTGAHRGIYLASLLLMSGAFALLAIDSVLAWYSPIFGVIIGVAMAAQGTIGPTFIVGADLDTDTVARQLTASNLTFPAGQLLGAVIIGIAQVAGIGAQPLFWIAAGTMLAFTLATWPAMGTPVRRLRQAEEKRAETKRAASEPPRAKPAASHAVGTATGPVLLHGPRERPARQRLLTTAFGAFLVVVMISSIGNNGLTSQLANVMPAVYGFSAAQTSLLLGAAGLLNLVVIVVAGRWMTHTGGLPVYVAGTIARAGGALVMALIGLVTSPVLILAAIAMLITYQGVPIPRLAANDVAARLATVSPAQANGLYFAASALGSVIGCLVAGFLADWRMDAVIWFAAIAGIIALIAALTWLIPASRRQSA